MPYHFSWYKEKRIVLVVVTRVFTVDEMEAFGNELIDKYLEVGNAPVHLIGDAQKMHQFPTSLIKVRQINERWLKHPNLGWIIAISQDKTLLNFVATSVTKVIGINYHMVATYDEALATLRKVDPSLTQLNALDNRLCP